MADQNNFEKGLRSRTKAAEAEATKLRSERDGARRKLDALEGAVKGAEAWSERVFAAMPCYEGRKPSAGAPEFCNTAEVRCTCKTLYDAAMFLAKISEQSLQDSRK
jgi:hypothetical protein